MELYDFFSVPRKVLAIRVAKMLISSILEIMKSCEAREPNTKERNMRLLFQERYKKKKVEHFNKLLFGCYDLRSRSTNRER